MKVPRELGGSGASLRPTAPPLTNLMTTATNGIEDQGSPPTSDNYPASEWRPVPGYEGLYQVAADGRVRSVDRVIETATGPRHYRGVELRIVGRSVWLYRPGCRGGRGRSFCVTTLVRAAFGEVV